MTLCDNDFSPEYLCLEGSKYFVKNCDVCSKICNCGILVGLQYKCISRKVFLTVLDDNVLMKKMQFDCLCALQILKTAVID